MHVTLLDIVNLLHLVANVLISLVLYRIALMFLVWLLLGCKDLCVAMRWPASMMACVCVAMRWPASVMTCVCVAIVHCSSLELLMFCHDCL